MIFRMREAFRSCSRRTLTSGDRIELAECSANLNAMEKILERLREE